MNFAACLKIAQVERLLIIQTLFDESLRHTQFHRISRTVEGALMVDAWLLFMRFITSVTKTFSINGSWFKGQEQSY